MVPLSSISGGRCCCVSVDDAGEAALRLKRLGVCSGREIEIVHAGDPMILRVIGTHIGLSRQLAERVQVRLIECDLSVAGRPAAGSRQESPSVD